MRFGEIRELTNPFPGWQALPRLGDRGTSSDGTGLRGPHGGWEEHAWVGRGWGVVGGCGLAAVARLAANPYSYQLADRAHRRI